MKNCSATQLKLSERLKSKRLNKYLGGPNKGKTATSYIQKNEEGSQSSHRKISIRIPGSKYREIKKSQERNKAATWINSIKLKTDAK